LNRLNSSATCHEIPLENQVVSQDQGAGNHQRKHCGQESAIDFRKRVERVIMGTLQVSHLLIIIYHSPITVKLYQR
jgi:hypothetical protein